MRWPWSNPQPQPRERRSYTDSLLLAQQQYVNAETASTAASAAVEAVGGLLARSLTCATVAGPSWALAAISPCWLGQVARELVRFGQHLSVMDLDGSGELMLTPAAHWHWRGPARPEREWRATASLYGPSDTITAEVSREETVFVQWSRLSSRPYVGYAAARLSELAAKAAAEVEKSLGDEASGPIAQIIPIPDQKSGDDDEFEDVRDAIPKARGDAMLLETTAGGFGDRGGAPLRDWKSERLGPKPPEALVRLADATFSRLVAASGASVALFTDADGTAQREALRRWHLYTVLPTVKLLETELRARLEADIRLTVDHYGADLAGRAAAFAKLVAGGMELEKAAAVSGVLMDDGR